MVLDASTARMLRIYDETGIKPPIGFLAQQFQAPARNFFETEAVTIDIKRSNERVAIAIQDLSVGPNWVSQDLYTNKAFLPPFFDEAQAIPALDLLKRQAGYDPFNQPSVMAKLTIKSMEAIRDIEAAMRRVIELQASQIFQTGTVSLIDGSGNVVYVIDYKPKATHFTTAGTAWDQAGATISADIIAVCEVIRSDGKLDPDLSMWGASAFEAAMANTAFKARFETRRLDQGTIVPFEMRNDGGQYRGQIDMGNFKLDVWTYGGRYEHAQTGTSTQFIDPANVVIRASMGRLDATFGWVPRIENGQSRLMPGVPTEMILPGLRLSPNAWISQGNTALNVGAGMRTLLIPTAIDTIGRIATGV